MEKRVAMSEDLPALELTKLRDLDLYDSPDDGMPPHVASASGVVRRGDFVYVIGDDLLQVAVFQVAGVEPGTLRRVFAGDLPDDRKQRKKEKPDLEGLTALPPVEGEPAGGLLGLGSGSNPHRDRGFFWSFAADGSLAGQPRAIDLHPVYNAVRRELDDRVNIEGAAVVANHLWLFHRANESQAANAIAEVELTDLSRTLAEDLVLEAGELGSLRTYDLGNLDGVPACFSDATTVLDDLVCFTASAEGTDDGDIRGSVVGTIDASGAVHRLRRIDPQWKVEGVHAAVDTGVIDFLFVCDQDEPSTPSPLLSATMPIDAKFDRRESKAAGASG